MSRINVFTGHFGSGKTEIAINYALRLAEQGKKTALVDIDIVNPYFCVRDIKDYLEDRGVKVISANPNFSNAELMVVPPEVLTVFNDKSYNVVFDIGGDDQGAVVLGRYNQYFNAEDYDMYLVVNNNRPFTSTVNDCKEYLKYIELASRLKVKYLISNTHMCHETSEEDILKGDKVVKNMSEETGLEYKYTVCTKNLEKSIKDKVHGEIFTIDTYMKTPWNK